MNVLFLTESYHPVLGGGETHIRELSRRLCAAGLGATVLTRRTDAAWPAEEMLEGVRILRVPPSGPGRYGKFGMVPFSVAKLLAAAGRCDVLCVRGTRVLGLPGLLAGRLRRIPVVMQPELNGELSGEVFTWGTGRERAPWRQLTAAATSARNLILRDADAFVAMSRRIEDELQRAGVPAEKVAYVPHGVDTERFHPATDAERAELRERLGLPRGASVVCYTGRLLKGKGLETLVAAFARVAARRPEAHLLIVGSGSGQLLSLEEDLRESVRRSGMGDRVTFTGRVEDVPAWLRAADLFAFPSVYEALGLSLVEAAACGLCCVGARTGGIVDVIEEGRSGLLFEPADAEGLANRLEALLSDPARRALLGARGREIALARFDVRDSVHRYKALFRELAASRPAGGRVR